MKASIATALMAPLLVSANGPGGGAYGRRGSGGGGRPGKGGPGGFGCGYDDDSCGLWGGDGCASSCFSSFWESATPTPTAFCDGNSGLHTCIESACDEDQDRFNSYSSRRSSLCSEFSTCDSTGTYTYTYKTPDAGWAGGRFSDRTWPTGEVVYTGCPWNGDGWGFPFWGGLGYGDDFWNGGRPGWNLATVTSTVAADSTSAVVTLEQAVSGDTTTFRTLGIEEPAETSQPSTNAAPGSLNGVKVVGAALGAVVVVAGML